jgi:uncharacterized lipoprotein YddW (UPF0748 family)
VLDLSVAVPFAEVDEQIDRALQELDNLVVSIASPIAFEKLLMIPIRESPLASRARTVLFWKHFQLATLLLGHKVCRLELF